jgi:hypothetical protein
MGLVKPNPANEVRAALSAKLDQALVKVQYTADRKDRL